MIDEFSKLIEKNWSTYGSTEPYERDRISLTKFCQRVVQPHTKVLFFVTYRSAPLCILKTVRAPEHSANLRREAAHQAAAPQVGVLSAPHVFWVDEVEGNAVYAETYVDALPVSLKGYRALTREIAAFSTALPHAGAVRSDVLADRITSFLPDDLIIAKHLQVLREERVNLELGMTHGDLGRQNVLGTKRRAWVIDWERAGDIYIRHFDVAAYVLRLYRHNEAQQAGALADILTLNKSTAKTLLAVTALMVRLYKQYPNAYRAVVDAERAMVP